MKSEVCQSCAMPLKTAENFGTEADGAPSNDYCTHCYQGGKFVYDSTLEQAVQANIPWWKQEGDTDEDAKNRIMAVFPNLKRWAK